jgi:hypothetical protein
MFFINTLDFKNRSDFPHTARIRRVPGGYLAAAAGASGGELITPPLEPTGMTSYEGFEIFPETGIEVGIAKVNNDRSLIFYKFDKDKWVATTKPVVYQPEQIRQWIKFWYGKISFYLKISPNAVLDTLKVGYWIDEHPLSYALEYGLPGLLQSANVRIFRHLQPVSKNAIAFPLKLPAHQIQEVTIQPLGHPPRPARLTYRESSYWIEDQENRLIPQENVKVSFTFRLPVDSLEGPYQPSSIPCVLIRNLNGLNSVRSSIVDWIRIDSVMIREWSAEFQHDQLVQVEILAETYDEIRLLGEQLIGLLGERNYIRAYPFEMNIPFTISTGLNTDIYKEIPGGLPRGSFRLRLIGLTQGEKTAVRRLVLPETSVHVKSLPSTYKTPILNPNANLFVVLFIRQEYLIFTSTAFSWTIELPPFAPLVLF